MPSGFTVKSTSSKFVYAVNKYDLETNISCFLMLPSAGNVILTAQREKYSNKKGEEIITNNFVMFVNAIINDVEGLVLQDVDGATGNVKSNHVVVMKSTRHAEAVSNGLIPPIKKGDRKETVIYDNMNDQINGGMLKICWNCGLDADQTATLSEVINQYVVFICIGKKNPASTLQPRVNKIMMSSVEDIKNIQCFFRALTVYEARSQIITDAPAHIQQALTYAIDHSTTRKRTVKKFLKPQLAAADANSVEYQKPPKIVCSGLTPMAPAATAVANIVEAAGAAPSLTDDDNNNNNNEEEGDEDDEDTFEEDEDAYEAAIRLAMNERRRKLLAKKKKHSAAVVVDMTAADEDE